MPFTDQPQLLLFFLFASVMILSSLGVIFHPNPITAAVLLVLSFFFTGSDLRGDERDLYSHNAATGLRRSDYGISRVRIDVTVASGRCTSVFYFRKTN